MMTTADYFKRAGISDACGEWIFRGVFALSAVALLFPQPSVQEIVNPMLIAAAVAGVVVGAVGPIWQNEGNRLLRCTQLTNALGAPLGEDARKNYYNNLVPASPDRLVVTTFENSFFTTEILQHMLWRRRLVAGGYLLVFVLLIASRWTSSGSLVLLAQTVFSVDVVLHWIRMERFSYRVNRVRQGLHQFFVQGGTAGDQNGLAITLAAFADYECAKDEAAMPIDGRLFKKLNPKLSKQWDQLRATLKIP
jgi:hypothetical protein